MVLRVVLAANGTSGLQHTKRLLDGMVCIVARVGLVRTVGFDIAYYRFRIVAPCEGAESVTPVTLGLCIRGPGGPATERGALDTAEVSVRVVGGDLRKLLRPVRPFAVSRLRCSMGIESWIDPPRRRSIDRCPPTPYGAGARKKLESIRPPQ